MLVTTGKRFTNEQPPVSAKFAKEWRMGSIQLRGTSKAGSSAVALFQ
jgi:hypothetical protein